ncbi:FUSC family protein [Variovorax sp. dw_308]|uniref:FUSC family protein n=1 Tax=Variovorax sp. dw_308 TaxID=2721546 RepID=UPI001C47F771|nr:FUSC family protein [Variovorax sp. dw_308]
MATRASEQRPAAPLASFLELLAPSPGRLEFALRLALICALATLVAETYQTPEAALTAYVAFFVMKPDRATSVIMSLAILILITLIISFVLVVSTVVIDYPLWRVAAMAVLSFGLLFVATASKLRPIGGILALVVAYALDLLSNAQIGELATRGLLYAWLFAGIPASVSIAVNLLVGPAPRRLAERALAHRLAVAADVLATSAARSREVLGECLAEGSGEIQKWLKLAAAEKSSAAADIAALRQATASTTQILLLVDLVERSAAGTWPPPLRHRVAGTLEEMASVLRAGGYPVEIALPLEDTEPALPPEGAAILAEMKEALAHFAEPPLPEAPPPEHPPTPAQPQPAGGFFLPDAFTNPEHVQYALKTTAAAMFCYVVYTLLEWPGIHTSLITCYIVSLGTAAETVEKLTLRILGCLVGAAAGLATLVFVMPSVTSISGLLTIVFLAALASGWIAAGTPRIAYAGFQIAFAFFLCVIQGAGPGFDMVVARDRVVGILFGNLVVYAVFTAIWPVSVARRIDPAIASVLRQLSAMILAAGHSKRYAIAGEAHATMGTLRQDMGLLRYEPGSIRPARDWLAARTQATQEIADLQGPLLLSASLDPVQAHRIAHRLDRLADGDGDRQAASGVGIGSPFAAWRQDLPDISTRAMRRHIDAHLVSLEQALVHESSEGQDGRADHAPA